MREIAFEIQEGTGQPVFLQLSREIITAIETGRLKPGQRLPGTRALAKTLNLHRNTVDAAYHEATMQGWLTAQPARGTFVAHDLPLDPVPARRRSKPLPATGARKASEAENGPPLLEFSDGAPDARLLPATELARALRNALHRPDLLNGAGYGDPRGVRALREALCLHLSAERGLEVDLDDLIVTRGSQMALFLAAAALIGPGEAIAVEEPGYPLAVSAFRAAGARVIPVPVDADGISVDDLARIISETPDIRAVYVTPHHQYPTTVTLGAVRRIGLSELARQHEFTIIEDDYDHEYRFDGRPVLPLAARMGHEKGLIYVGSLSKVLAPGLRLGDATGPTELIRRMADLRQAIDRQGDVVLEQAVASLLHEGDLGRHTRKTRRIYQVRRDRMAELLAEKFPNELSFTLPAGGLALWARIGQGLDAERWSRAARRMGLSVTPGISHCIEVTHAPQAFRIGFANLDEREATNAVVLLKKAQESLC